MKAAARKIDSEVKQYLPDNITAYDVSTCNERLKLVKDKFEKFDDLVSDLVTDLDSTNATDQARIDTLEKELEELRASVINNEKLIKEKIQQLLVAQPMSPAEREKLELKKSSSLLVRKKRKPLKPRKFKKPW